MLLPLNGCNSAFCMLCMQILMTSVFTNHITSKWTALQSSTNGIANSTWPNPFYKGMNYFKCKSTSEQDIYFREGKSMNPARILSIDLSGLRPRSTDVPNGPQHPSPVKLLGIDISVLSRNPEPKLPIARTIFELSKGDKTLIRNDFDPRYDRLPIIATERMHKPKQPPQMTTKNNLLHPFQHLPLNMLTYYSILKNKKQGRNFKIKETSLNEKENEMEYTANFILHLLYHISSNHQKEFGK